MAKRPYSNESVSELECTAYDAYDDQDSESLNQIIDELTNHRHNSAAARLAVALRELQAEMAKRQVKPSARSGHARLRKSLEGSGPPDDWLDAVQRVSRTIRAKTTGESCVYHVLLRMSGPLRFALYVGQTGIPVEERYAQHKSGVKAGRRYVTRFGIGLLYPFFEHLQGISSTESRNLEPVLFEALRAAHFEVYGGH